ncbi:MAG TPA: polysaccharide deacetylase [Microbacterium sp.]|nr:polysaccharide deacetylase [Microbacterium sp.]
MEVRSFDVALTFDVDAETLWLNRDPENASRPVVMSQGRYGATVGLRRILDLLEDHSVVATFFVPGWVAEQYPAEISDIVARGHEVGHHGYLHEWPSRLNRDEERAVLGRGLEALTRTIGVRPLGYRAPGLELSVNTLELLADEGFRYSSNLMDADVPYVVEVGARNLVELPLDWALTDSTHFLYALQLPGTRIAASSVAREIWFDALDAARAAGHPFLLTMHPQLIGRPYRIGLLDAVIRRAKARGNARFVTCFALAATFHDAPER